MGIKGLIHSIYETAAKILSKHKLWQYYIDKIVGKKIRSYLKLEYVEINGHKMFLDQYDSLQLSIHGIHEPHETEVVKNEIKKGQVVLDIGANIGYYTLIFANLVGNEGIVYAFEPNPTNFSLLKKNVEINGYHNVTIIPNAVSDKNGKTTLFLGKDNMVTHRIFDAQIDPRKTIDVDVISLDEYFKNYNRRIDFIKMDVEGFLNSVLFEECILSCYKIWRMSHY